jgi:FkbM family methyltransferase
MHIKRILNLTKRVARFLVNKVLGDIQIKTSYLGSDFYYPSGSDIGETIKSGGIWDKKIIDYIKQNTDRKISVILEVGANIGASSLYMSKVFDESFIVMIEGSSRYRYYLQKNTDSGNVNGEIKATLISGHSGKKFILKTNSTTGTPSQAEYSIDETSAEILTSLTLDELFLETRLKQVDILKVDTDGFEEEVLIGARSVLAFKPIVFLEFSPNSLNRITDPKNVIGLLFKNGYTNYQVFSPDGLHLGLAKSYEDIMILKKDLYYVDIITGI